MGKERMEARPIVTIVKMADVFMVDILWRPLLDARNRYIRPRVNCLNCDVVAHVDGGLDDLFAGGL